MLQENGESVANDSGSELDFFVPRAGSSNSITVEQVNNGNGNYKKF
jgi:hypothetical protein